MTRFLTTLMLVGSIGLFAAAATAGHHEGGDHASHAEEAGEKHECNHAEGEPCEHHAEKGEKQCTHAKDEPCKHHADEPAEGAEG